MARLIDDLRASTYRTRITPQTYVYNFTRPPAESINVPHTTESDTSYAEFVQRLNNSPVLVIDRVTDYVFGSPRENWELAEDLPCLIPKVKSLFMETRRPKKDLYFNKESESPLPGAWGWMVHHIGGDTLRKHAAGFDVPVPSEATQAIHCTLTVQMPSPIDLVVAPVYTYIWPLNARGAMVGLPMRGYGVQMDSNFLPPPDIPDHYFSVLLIPALMTLAFLNSDLVGYQTTKHTEKLQAVRKKRNRLPLANYNTLTIDKLVDVLRYDGQSGLLGLRHALKTCRRFFLHGAPRVVSIHER